MEKIVLNRIDNNGSELSYDFSITEGLSRYFTDRLFSIIYPLDISTLPDAVAAVPFVCNVLPIVWLTDSKLFIPELDESFYTCIPNIKKGYEAMFPESDFRGEIAVGKIVPCDASGQGRSAAFFSGGLDATQTLVTHFSEKPDLVSIWGSDIKFDNEDGWNNVHKVIEETSKRFGLADIVIRSAFREFDNERELSRTFGPQLKDGWWHGVKHGLGLLGHAAPYAYLQGLSRVYIASSNCPADGVVRCASHPSIDNQVCFCNCRVVHDGFEFSRQGKAANVVKFCEETGNRVTIHACWQSQTGHNCCRCEKCFRTMVGLMAEGADPVDYGFTEAYDYLPHMPYILINSPEFTPGVSKTQWVHIHNRIHSNKSKLNNTKYWKYLKWVDKSDFLHRETLRIPFMYRVRRKLLKILR